MYINMSQYIYQYEIFHIFHTYFSICISHISQKGLHMSQLSKENIKSFKYCDLNFANGGTEDDFIHCLKKEQPSKAGRQKLNSQLSILVGK